MNPSTIRILGQEVQFHTDYLDIHELKFLSDNPRLCGCTHEISGFADMPEQQQQEIVFEQLKKQPSVKDLVADVKRHDGLLENILVYRKTREVIEGNSRLAVYRILSEQDPDGEWELIPCNVVIDELTLEQRAAFLNQIHVKGKSEWSAFAKANFAYAHFEKGWNANRIASIFGESPSTIRKRIKTIELMRSNEDPQLFNFSFYKVLTDNPTISSALKEVDGLKDVVLEQVKSLGSGENRGDFTAIELRKQLPVILDKPKAIKKYIDGALDLNGAFLIAEVSSAEENVKRARGLIDSISDRELLQLDQISINRLRYEANKLKTEVQRFSNLVAGLEGL